MKSKSTPKVSDKYDFYKEYWLTRLNSFDNLLGELPKDITQINEMTLEQLKALKSEIEIFPEFDEQKELERASPKGQKVLSHAITQKGTFGLGLQRASKDRIDAIDAYKSFRQAWRNKGYILQVTRSILSKIIEKANILETLNKAQEDRADLDENAVLSAVSEIGQTDISHDISRYPLEVPDQVSYDTHVRYDTEIRTAINNINELRQAKIKNITKAIDSFKSHVNSLAKTYEHAKTGSAGKSSLAFAVYDLAEKVLTQLEKSHTEYLDITKGKSTGQFIEELEGVQNSTDFKRAQQDSSSQFRMWSKEPLQQFKKALDELKASNAPKAPENK